MMSKLNDLTENYKYLQFSAAAMDGEFMWTVAENFNAIYRIRKSDFMTEFVCAIPGEDNLALELYASGIIMVERKLYLIPGTAKRIAIYHIDDNEFTFLSTEEMQGDHYPKFGVVYQKEQYIYLFPQSMQVSYVLRIDTKTDIMERIEFVLDFNAPKERNDIFFFGCCVSDSTWVGVGCPRVLGRFDDLTKRFSFRKLSKTNSYVYHIVEHEGWLYLLTLQNEVIAFDPNTGKENLIWKDVNEAPEQYSRIIYYKNALWLFPFRSNHIVKIAGEKLAQVEYIQLPETIKVWKRRGGEERKYYGYYTENDMMYLYPGTTSCILGVCIKNSEIFSYKTYSHRGKELKDELFKQELENLNYKDDLQYLIDILNYREVENDYEVEK